MNREELKVLWKKEEEMNFKGWDFSHLKDRWEDEVLPWDYEDVLRSYLKPEYKLLDMHTGGGEFILSLGHPYENTTVTEMWAPNVKLCRETLKPLGIAVEEVESDERLPFLDNSFHIILNRHGSFSLKEIKRILKPNGIFITQQVGGKNNSKLSNLLIEGFEGKSLENTLDNTLKIALENEFKVLYKDEYFPYLRFKDAGAVVYFAKVIEWEFPNFSVEKCFDKLMIVNKEIEEKGYYESFEHRYIMVLRNS